MRMRARATTRPPWEHLDLLIIGDHWHASNGDAGLLGPLRLPSADLVYLYAALLDHYGRQGWDLVGATAQGESQRFFFKRPGAGPPAAPASGDPAAAPPAVAPRRLGVRRGLSGGS